MAALAVATVATAGVLASGTVVSAQDADDDTRATAQTIEMNSTTNGTLEDRNDTDWYAVEAGELEEGETARLTYDATADVNHDGRYTYTKTMVEGPDGERVASSDPRGYGESDFVTYTFTADESGTHSVYATNADVGAWGVDGNDVTRYELRVDLVCET